MKLSILLTYAYRNAEMLNYSLFFPSWNLLTMHCGNTFFANYTCNACFKKLSKKVYFLEKTSRL